MPTELDDSSHIIDTPSVTGLSPDISPDNSLCQSDDSIVALRDSIHSCLAVVCHFCDSVLVIIVYLVYIYNGTNTREFNSGVW